MLQLDVAVLVDVELADDGLADLLVRLVLDDGERLLEVLNGDAACGS